MVARRRGGPPRPPRDGSTQRLLRPAKQGYEAREAGRSPTADQGTTDHYFSRQPGVASKPVEIEVTLRGGAYRLRTDRGVFSYGRLDAGTRLLIETMEISPQDTVLDFGCGYGAIGIAAAALAPEGFAWLVDSNKRAVQLARENLDLNRIRNARTRRVDDLAALPDAVFDVILSNPPLHAGWAVVDAMMAQARDRLRPAGRLYVVARTDKGAKTLARRLGQWFGRVTEVAKRAGYRVYRAEGEGQNVEKSV